MQDEHEKFVLHAYVNRVSEILNDSSSYYFFSLFLCSILNSPCREQKNKGKKRGGQKYTGNMNKYLLLLFVFFL